MTPWMLHGSSIGGYNGVRYVVPVHPNETQRFCSHSSDVRTDLDFSKHVNNTVYESSMKLKKVKRVDMEMNSRGILALLLLSVPIYDL